MKGVVTLEDGQLVVAQRVGRRWSIESAPVNGAASGQLAVIALAVIALADSIDIARLGP